VYATRMNNEKDSEGYNEAYVRAKQAQSRSGALNPTPNIPTDEHPRLPPGQVETKKFPILDLGIRPSLARYSLWKLEVRGLVENPIHFGIDEVKKLHSGPMTADFHCVTRWSRYDITWTGVPFKIILDLVKPHDDAQFVTFHAFDGYTTNVALEELKKKDVIIAYELEGEEIPPEHGGPIRMIIPHLYGWKSAKFLTGIEFMDHDEPGFWEVRGYSNNARPWIEERYDSQNQP